MKRVLTTALIALAFLIPATSQAQKWQEALLYGKNENRLLVNFLLGLPNDTLTPPSAATVGSTTMDLRLKPWIGVKNNAAYLWHTVDFKWVPLGGGAGISNNANVGAGYRFLKPSTQEIKTVFGGYGVLWDSTSNADGLTSTVDSATLSAYYLRRKDSLTGTNLLGYLTKTTLDDTAAAIRADFPTAPTDYWKLTGNLGFNPATQYFGVNDSIQGIPFKLNGHYYSWIGNHSDLTNPTGPFFFTEGGLQTWGMHAGKNLIPRVIANDAWTRFGGGGYGGGNIIAGTAAGMSIGTIADSSYANQAIPTEMVLIGWQAGQSWQFAKQAGSGGGRSVVIGSNAGRSIIASSNLVSIGFSNMEYLSKGYNMTSVGGSGFRSAVDNVGGAGLGVSHGQFSSTGINTVTMTNGGSDYHQDSVDVIFSTPLQTEAGSQCDFPATGRAIVVGGAIVGVEVTYPGCGYSTVRSRRYFIASDPSLGLHPLPTVTFVSTRVGGLGTGATGTPVVSSGDYETPIGTAAMQFYLMGQNNSSIGNQTGNGKTRYADSLTTMLGAFSGPDVSNSTTNLVRYINSTAVGANSAFNKSNQMVFGDPNVVEIKMNADTLYVPDLDVIYGTNNSVAFSNIGVLSHDSVFKINSRKYPTRNKFTAGLYNFAVTMDQTFDTTRTDGNLNRYVLSITENVDSSHKFSKTSMISTHRIFQPYDSMTTVFGVNTHRPYATTESRTTWYLPRARYTLIGGVNTPNSNLLNNMIVGANQDTVSITVSSNLLAGMWNVYNRFDAAPNASQFIQHNGWYGNMLSVFKDNNKANSVFERFNHIAIATPQDGNNGQSVTTMVGVYIEGQKDAAYTVTNPYAIWAAGVNDTLRGDGIVRFPNLPAGKKAKQVFWENGVLYQGDSTGTGGTGGSPGSPDLSFQYNASGTFTGSPMMSQQTSQVLIQGNSSEITPFVVDGHEDLTTGDIVQFTRTGTTYFAMSGSGIMTTAETTAPSTPAAGYFYTYVKSDGKIYGKNDAGTEYDLTAGGADTHIGNTNLTLSGARTLTFGGNSLQFAGTGSFSNATTISLAFDASTGLNMTNVPTGDGENLLSVIDGGLENGKIYQVTIGSGLDLTAGVLSAPGGSGEANTASNLGGGLANWDSKVGVDLRFNSFNASDFNLASNLISIDYTNGQAASGSNKGFLTSADWTTFNNKASVTNGTNNRIVTSLAADNTLNAEANFTYNGALAEITVQGLGTTQDDTKGLDIINPDVAAAGLQQISPAVRWSGQGWKTDATAASQEVEFRAFALPVEGTSQPYGYWKLQSSINGAAYTDVLSVSDVLGSILNTGSNFTINTDAGGQSKFNVNTLGNYSVMTLEYQGGTDGLSIQATNFGENYINSVNDAPLIFQKAGTEKFRMSATGIDVSGSNEVHFGSATEKIFGGLGGDLYLYSNINVLTRIAGTSVLNVAGASIYAYQELRMNEMTAPGTPEADWAEIYPKSDGLWYGKDDAGVETKLSNDAAGANTALSNLAAVAINTSLLPGTDDAIDLGSPTKQWRDLYMTGASIYMSGVKTLSSSGLDLPTGAGLRTRTSAGNTLLLQAYDVDGAAYTTFATLTANNTPTLDLSTAVTIGGNPVASTASNITGSAATLTTTRTIWGQNFNGSANVTGDLTLNGSNLVMTGSIASTGSRVTKGWFTDGEFTNMITIGGTALNSLTTTLTNKRITKRVTSTASGGATPTMNTDNADVFIFTAQAAAITSMTTNLSGTPTDGQTLWIAITDNGTARAITWGASFEASTVPLPTTTVISTRMDNLFVWNATTSKWRIIASQDLRWLAPILISMALAELRRRRRSVFVQILKPAA